MNTSLFRHLALAPAILVLAGCAAVAGQHRHDAGGPRPGGMGASQGMMDMDQMCEMHRAMRPEDRPAMMEERMRSMPPEMHGRMQQMMQNCR